MPSGPLRENLSSLKKYDATIVGLVVLDILGRPIEKIPEGGNLEYIEELRLTVAGTAGGTAGARGAGGRTRGGIGNKKRRRRSWRRRS